MPTITIIVDPRGMWPDTASDAPRVETDGDYFIARRRVRDALRSGSQLTILLLNAALLSWFDDLLLSGVAEVAHYAPRTQLAKLLSVDELPQSLTDQLIEAEGLLRLAAEKPRRPGENVLDWAVRVMLGEGLDRAQLNPQRVGDVLGCLALLDKHAPDVTEVVKSWLLSLQRQGPHNQLWEWLAEDPAHRAKLLAATRATVGYEERWQWLSQEGFSHEEISSSRQLFDRLGLRFAVDDMVLSAELRKLLKKRLSDNLRHESTRALSSATGKLAAELDAIAEWLRGRAASGEMLQTSEADEIADWLAEAKPSPKVEEIRYCVHLLAAPEKAPLPPADASWEQMAHWIEKCYMPAYQRYAAAGLLDETASYVAAFEAWVLKNYLSLVTQPGIMSHYFVRAAEDHGDDAGMLVIILDGVPYPAAALLCDELAKQPNVYLASRRVHLALLPTVTAINKPCIRASCLPDQCPDADSAHPERKLTLDGGFNVEAHALSSAQPTFYHLRRTDESVLHRPMHPLDRWLELRRCMTGLSAQITELFARASRDQQPLWVGIISDHGWSELPRGAAAVEVPGDLAKLVHHGRVLWEKADACLGYALDADRFLLPRSCTIAAGYSYLGSRPPGAVHGGATPQEMAVLGFWVTNAEVEAFEDLRVEIEGHLRRGVANNPVRVKIFNPNPVAATLRDLTLSRVALTTSVKLPVEVPAGGETVLQAQCDTSDLRSTLEIAGSLDWRAKDRPRRQQVRLLCRTVGAAETSQSFEDMFRR